jgi:hypothetical protein
MAGSLYLFCLMCSACLYREGKGNRTYYERPRKLSRRERRGSTVMEVT